VPNANDMPWMLECDWDTEAKWSHINSVWRKRELLEMQNMQWANWTGEFWKSWIGRMWESQPEFNKMPLMPWSTKP